MFLKHYLILSGGQIGAMVSSLIARVILARILGPAFLGIFSIGLNANTLACKIFSFGTLPAAQYFGSKYGNRKQDVLWTAFIVGLMASLIAVATIWLALPWINRIFFENQPQAFGVFKSFMPLIPLVILGGILTILLIPYNEIAHYSVAQLIAATGVPISFLILLHVCDNDLNAAIMSQQIVWIVCLLYPAMLLWRYFFTRPATSDLTTGMVKYSLQAWPNMILNIGIMRLGILFSARILTAKDIGLFVVALNVTEGIFSLSGPLGQLLLTRVGKNPNEGMIFTLQALRISTALLVIISGVYILVGYPVFILLFGISYKSSWTLSVILLITGSCHVLTKIVANYFGGIGKPSLITVPLAVEFSLLIVLLHVLCPLYRGTGLAWSTVLASSGSFIIANIFLIRVMKCRVRDIFVVKPSDLKLLKSQITNFINTKKQG